MARSSLTNVVARACINDLHDHNLPTTHRQWASRRMTITAAVARVTGMRYTDIYPVVMQTMTKTHAVVRLNPAR